MKELKSYNLKVSIHHPEKAEMKYTYEYIVNFFKDEKGYGNKSYMQLAHTDGTPFNYFDLRYNNAYDPNYQISFIALWADTYWSGNDGAWVLDGLVISRR